MAVSERVFPAVPFQIGGGRILPSPNQFYLTGEDFLRVVCSNSAAGVTLKIQLRTANALGDTVAHSEDHVPASDRSETREDYAIGSGSLLNVTVFARTGAPLIGQTFVIVQLVRGRGDNAVVLGTLLAGYVTECQALGFPGSPIQTSIEGGGYVRNIVGTDPAAGSEIVETVPAGARWELLSFSAFITKAAVNGGPMELRKIVGANTFWQVVASHTHTAGATINYIFAQALNTVSAGPPGTGTSNHALPSNCFFNSGDKLQTSLVNNAGDNWSAPVFAVREWLEVD